MLPDVRQRNVSCQRRARECVQISELPYPTVARMLSNANGPTRLQLRIRQRVRLHVGSTTLSPYAGCFELSRQLSHRVARHRLRDHVILSLAPTCALTLHVRVHAEDFGKRSFRALIARDDCEPSVLRRVHGLARSKPSAGAIDRRSSDERTRGFLKQL